MSKPFESFTYRDGTKNDNTGDYVDRDLIVAPIYLTLDSGQGTGERTYCFYLGVVPKRLVINVKAFAMSDIKYYGAIFIGLVLSLLLSTYCVF